VKLARAVLTWGRMVKFPHSLFALPFAFSGAALAAVHSGIGWRQVFWIGVAMVGARNAAMGFNRLADHTLDARNPRTAGRALPRGELSRAAVWAFTILLSTLFVFAAFRLNALCGWLSPAALLIVFGYSYTKRFTWASHVFLGLALAMAPVGGWLAVSGSFDRVAWLLGLAVLLWVAGFDVIYACQDVDFDRRSGLHSIPARFGTAGALAASRMLHAGAVAALAGVGLLADLHPVYWLGWGIICALLVWEHRLVRSGDPSKAGLAFFNVNGAVSVLYLAAVLAALLAPRVLR
jgi:4-hydroxybenzoate polyprenyltransferase